MFAVLVVFGLFFFLGVSLAPFFLRYFVSFLFFFRAPCQVPLLSCTVLALVLPGLSDERAPRDGLALLWSYVPRYWWRILCPPMMLRALVRTSKRSRSFVVFVRWRRFLGIAVSSLKRSWLGGY